MGHCVMNEGPFYANAAYAHRTNQTVVVNFLLTESMKTPDNKTVVKSQTEVVQVVFPIERMADLLVLRHQVLQPPGTSSGQSSTRG